MQANPTQWTGLNDWWIADHWLWAVGMHSLVGLVLVVLAIAVVFAFGRLQAGPRHLRHDNTPKTLDARYARGEIDRAQYLECKRAPGSRPGQGEGRP